MLDAEPWLEHAFGTALAQPGGRWRELKQVHSSRVVEYDEWREGLEADALVAPEPGMRIGVRSADCLPILLADPEKRVVAAVHAGWRGCVAAIAVHAVEKMQQAFGCRPGDLVAAFGPSIRACCFEVGPEVAQQFAPWFPERYDLDRRTHVDLPEASLRQLVSAGLRAERVSSGAPCTVCGGGLAEPHEFHSWRRDHKTGARMHSVIWIR
ncbi:MAG: peptidoglycan editing factor PgeF [Bryobacteraceae bacterium]|nr:peptidoglycan editing factor PgeF [Bryobacteraceae bacterium]